jgi:hypothetical protein
MLSKPSVLGILARAYQCLKLSSLSPFRHGVGHCTGHHGRDKKDTHNNGPRLANCSRLVLGEIFFDFFGAAVATSA